MEESKKQKTCNEKIEENFRGRMQDFLPDISSWGVLKCARYLKSEGRTLTTADIEDLRGEALELVRERACESVLSLEKITTYKLCLSWGGPSDYFELDWSDESRSWVGGRYIFQDWFDGAERRVTAEQVEQLAELFGIYPDAV